jgi:hypothetical protein
MESELFINKKNADLVTADQFMNFLYQFNKPIICPVCASRLWDVQGPLSIDAVDGEAPHDVIESINYSRIKQDEDSVISYPGGLPLFRLTCNTCAYMMLFSYKRIRQLIENQKNAQTSSHDGEEKDA